MEKAYHTNKIQNETGDITTNTNEIQKIIGDYYKYLCSNKLGNPKGIDKLLDVHDISKPTQWGVNHLSTSIMSSENEAIIKILPRKKSSEFTSKFYQSPRKNLHQ
jgi:hypothetical protein